MKILTCNIRTFGAKDGENHWSHRKDICAGVISSKAPDIICFQEMWHEQFADLTNALPEFASYGKADEPTNRRPMNCIFYKKDAYTLISAGGFWLSKTPHITGTKSWDSTCVRLAN